MDNFFVFNFSIYCDFQILKIKELFLYTMPADIAGRGIGKQY